MLRVAILITILIGVVLLSTLIILQPQQTTQNDRIQLSAHRYRAVSDKSFDDVMLDLEFAITNENYNITSINSVGKVIAERHDIPFPNYAIVSSCSLEVAKQFLEIDPEYVTIMPCRIAVWEQHGKVQIDAQLVPEDDPRCVELCANTNALLKRVVDFAVEQ